MAVSSMHRNLWSCSFIEQVVSLTVVSRPTMDELLCIKKEDGSGEYLQVIRWITSYSSTKCEDFAHLLLKDPLVVRELRKETKNDDQFVRAVLASWLDRHDDDPTNKAVPCTWDNLALCVEQADVDGELVKAIRDNHP